MQLWPLSTVWKPHMLERVWHASEEEQWFIPRTHWDTVIHGDLFSVTSSGTHRETHRSTFCVKAWRGQWSTWSGQEGPERLWTNSIKQSVASRHCLSIFYQSHGKYFRMRTWGILFHKQNGYLHYFCWFISVQAFKIFTSLPFLCAHNSHLTGLLSLGLLV